MSTRGFSIIGLLLVLATIGILSIVVVPSMDVLRKRNALRSAVNEIRMIMRLGRSRAIARGANSAIKFKKIGEEWHYALVDDLDGDGVRNDDIQKGIDRLVGGYRRVHAHGSPVWIGMPLFAIRDPDTKKVLPPGASPVRFNVSTLCSFGPGGGGTAGSIFLTNRHHDVAMVRVLGATGRVRVITYDRGDERWGGS